MIIEVKCPSDQELFRLAISQEELRYAKENSELIQKAIFHELEKIVIIVFIDWQGKIRRQYSYPCGKNSEFEKLKAKKNPTNLIEAIEQMTFSAREK